MDVLRPARALLRRLCEVEPRCRGGPTAPSIHVPTGSVVFVAETWSRVDATHSLDSVKRLVVAVLACVVMT